MKSKLVIAVLVAASARTAAAAPADADVRAFFLRPDHSLSSAFAARLASADARALRRCLELLAAAPAETAQAELKDACAAEMKAGDLAPAAEEARALLASGPAQASVPPTAAPLKLKVPTFDLASAGSADHASMFDGSASKGAAVERKENEWYVTWGYNTERYAPVAVEFSQPSLGNDFKLEGRMHDQKGWDLWNHSITVPQYSFRVGKFIKKNTAIELNFDHAKAILEPDSRASISGTIGGAPVGGDVRVGDYVQKYKLNNGANFLLLNAVQRVPLIGTPGRTGSVALLAKAGVGIMLPHTENIVLGQENKAGFQYGGMGAGLEGAIRAHIVKSVFIEVAEKGFYGRYRNLNIYEGKAKQNLKALVTIVSIGTSF